MAHSPSELQYENDRLEQTIALAKEQLGQAKARREDTKLAILEAKQELRENTSHAIGNLWNGEDFEALAELTQYVNPIEEKIEDFEATEHRILRLQKLIQSPYFARIDFKFEDEAVFEQIYIGRSSLKKERHNEFYVYDWRAPIASVFYRFALGQAHYDAPGGRIGGEVGLKRQYEIHNSELEYFFDTDVQIIDEFLRKMLGQNTSAKMKTIVETIQKEQDTVIRDMDHDLMMVQGVAGSGKTSVALHRAAYLMYQGLSKRLSAGNILIISPNPLFEHYISGVLPELGEENVESVIFEDILARVLPEERIQDRNHFLEHLIANTAYRNVRKSSMELKTSPAFLNILERLIADLPHRFLAFQDVYYGGERIISGAALKQKVLAGGSQTPLGKRLGLLQDYLAELIRETKEGRTKRPDPLLLKEEVLGFMELRLKDIYRGLFADLAYFRQLAAGAVPAPELEEIAAYTLENLDYNRVCCDDAAAVLYLRLRLYGNDGFKDIRQVVIDEAQDYYPLHFEVFKLLFPRAKFTVLGDVNQTLEKQENLSFYRQIEGIFNKKRSAFAIMDKSFRCTNEILHYGLRFLGEGADIKSFNRSGEEPQVCQVGERAVYYGRLAAEVGVCLEQGYQSVGLICKTEKNARALYDGMKGQIGQLSFIKNGSVADLKGAFVIPVYMSKGLEFDAVLICDADAGNYHSEDDKKLLYIACTRALHRLNLFCLGVASPLVL